MRTGFTFVAPGLRRPEVASFENIIVLSTVYCDKIEAILQIDHGRTFHACGR